MINSQVELVFIPTPGVGHLYSAIQMAKLILDHHSRISILVLVLDLSTNSDHSSSVSDFIDFHSRQNCYPNRLSFLALPPLADPTSPSFFHSISLHNPLVKHAIQERTQHPGSTRIAGFVLDMFCADIMDVSNELHIPSYVYFTSGTNLFNLWLHLQSINDAQLDITSEFHVPGFVNRLTRRVIPRELSNDDKEISTLLFNHARRFRKCKGILMNTFIQFEPYGFQTLQNEVAKNNISKIYPVGPILDLEIEYKNQAGGCRKDEQDSILRWLDDQPPSSVVFLCFGSMGSFDADQVKELANGLEKSGYRFLWSLRNLSLLDALPQGFLNRIASKGKIIGWAPQILVLSHPGIGGFVSHCGWNSMLESLWFGVPIGTWPLYAEQHVNAFELVKELGLGVEVQTIEQQHDSKTSKANNNIVTAEEVANGVKKLMSLDEETKNKVREMGNKGRKALEEGGSSHKWLDCFIQDVLCNVVEQ